MRNVLFLCTGNSARSILAEATLTALGRSKFTGYSAGSEPKGAPHPLALATLAEQGHEYAGASSKSWTTFAAPGAPEMSAVITVCDNAAGEACPIWPGHPAAGHWGIPDPAGVVGDEDERAWAFGVAYARLRARIEDMLTLDWDGLVPAEISDGLNAIGAKHNEAEALRAQA